MGWYAVEILPKMGNNTKICLLPASTATYHGHREAHWCGHRLSGPIARGRRQPPYYFVFRYLAVFKRAGMCNPVHLTKLLLFLPPQP
jgi:hypothetical protein